MFSRSLITNLHFSTSYLLGKLSYKQKTGKKPEFFQFLQYNTKTIKLTRKISIMNLNTIKFFTTFVFSLFF